MTEKQRKTIEQRLLKERERVLEALRGLDETFAAAEDDGSLTNYPLHLADEGTDTMEREKDQLLASQEGRTLYEIDASLRTLYKEPDRFGTCAACGRDIAFERLDIIPWAKLCIDDERKAEAAS